MINELAAFISEKFEDSSDFNIIFQKCKLQDLLVSMYHCLKTNAPFRITNNDILGSALQKFEHDLINELIIYINIRFKSKYDFSNPHQKHRLKDILINLFYMLKTCVSYRNLQGSIPRSTLNSHFMFFVRKNVFVDFYKLLLDKYLENDRRNKLKYESIDTSFVPNFYGVENIGMNKFYKNKFGTKVSIVVDVNGIPISVVVDKGNIHDTQFVERNMTSMLTNPNKNKSGKKYKHRSKMLGDKGYDSHESRDTFEKNDFECVIDYNNRNTKDETKVKKLNPKEKVIYKKRIIVENMFSKMKKNRRLVMRYEKKLITFVSFVYMSFIKTLYKQLVA